MYSKSPFKMQQQACFDLLESQPFGLLTTCAQGKITQAFLPFILDKESNCLYGHLAQQNGQINALYKSSDLTITFQGEHAYISPNWYESDEQVPTWNYQAVVVTGNAVLLNNSETLKVITALSNRHEAQFETPWTMDKLPQKKTQAMLKAITGFRIEIAEVNGISKMSQNKSVRDKNGVVFGLKNQPDQASKNIASLISTLYTN